MTNGAIPDSQHWLRVEEILDQVLELESEDVAQASLNVLCVTDAGLKREVEELLEAARESQPRGRRWSWISRDGGTSGYSSFKRVGVSLIGKGSPSSLVGGARST